MTGNFRSAKVLVGGLLVLLLTGASLCDESLSTRFEVWPPETIIYKLRPGEGTGKIRAGQGGESITFSLEKDFGGDALGSTTLEFEAPGYSSLPLKVEAAELNGQTYSQPVRLTPVGTWSSLKDYARRNKVMLVLVFLVGSGLVLVRLETVMKERRAKILRVLSEGEDWQEKSGYYLLKKIGSGATANTWLCIRKSDLGAREVLFGNPDPERLAIKILEKAQPEPDAVDPDTGLDLETKREIESLRRCHHPAIVRVEDYGHINSKSYQPYIVMEYAEGKSLHAMIESGRRFSVQEMLKVAQQLCSGLQHLHETGAVHRDIKTENFIVNQELKVKIVDLGLAKTLEERDRLTALSVAASGFKGTGGYAPPWQLGAVEIDPSFDQYATAVCLAEMLAGCHPFELPQQYQAHQGHIKVLSKVMFQVFVPLSNYRQDLPENVCAFFEKYFQATTPGDVYGSMEEFYKELLSACGQQS